MSETAEDIRKAIREVLPSTLAESVVYFQRALADKGLVSSAELMNSFASALQEETEAVVGSVNFLDYGRYKDMKTLRWAGKAPPPDELEKWVKQKGINNFAWIPGYEKSGRVPVESIAVRRLASTISKAIRSVGVVDKKYSGTWYNSTKARLVNVTCARILNRVSELIAKKTAEMATGGVDINLSAE